MVWTTAAGQWLSLILVIPGDSNVGSPLGVPSVQINVPVDTERRPVHLRLVAAENNHHCIQLLRIIYLDINGGYL